MRILNCEANLGSRRTRKILGFAVCAAVSGSAIFSRADTTATWVSETSGDWTNTTQWSTAPNYPENGSPAGVNYQALINATGGTPYTATIDSDVSVDGITINSADATVDQSSGTLTAGTINIENGAYALEGGTISNTTFDVSNTDSFDIGTATLDGAAINMPAQSSNLIQVTNSLYVRNGLTGNNAELLLATDTGFGSTMYFDGPSQTVDGITIFGAQGANLYADGPTTTGSQTLTIGPSAVLNNVSLSNFNASDTAINNGTIVANFNRATGDNEL